MCPYYSDTHPEIEELQIGILRTFSPARKMELLASLNSAARKLALAGLRQRHPSASEDELIRRLADLLLGEELAEKVYGSGKFTTG